MDKDLVFLHQHLFPKASDIFSLEIKDIEDIEKDCLFIIDTNVLLVPYTTSSSGFVEINKAFRTLIGENRLFIPAQVAREFAKNRPEKIKILFQQLNQTKSKIQKPDTGSYPLLESLKEYKEAVELEKNIRKLQAEYSKKISGILENIKQWNWNDPVSSVYKELFSPEVVIDLNMSDDDVLKDLERRNKYSIPPGFNDKSKDDSGVGDLIIWQTILQIAKENKKDIIFVSGDEKNDWFYRSESQSLNPRFELITEFREHARDKSFHIIKLSRLLEILGASDEAVKEVEIKEVLDDVFTFKPVLLPNFDIFTKKAIYKWLLEAYPKKDVVQNDGFPDFYVSGDNSVVGVEFIWMSDDHKNTFLLDRFDRAKNALLERQFHSFEFIIVVKKDTSISSINEITSSFAHKLDGNIKITFGFIAGNSFFSIITYR